MHAKKNMDRQVRKPLPDVSLSAFAFLLSELVQYSQARVQSISDLEQRYAKTKNKTKTRN
jgi:trafficking protein particle complex subunit 5